VGAQRESGVNPELPRSGERERKPPEALAHRGWEAAAGRRGFSPCPQVRRPAGVPRL